jgi:hypothetical protein
MLLPKATPMSQRLHEPDYDYKHRLQARIEELEAALKAALSIIGHPDDATTQALWAVLERK